MSIHMERWTRHTDGSVEYELTFDGDVWHKRGHMEHGLPIPSLIIHPDGLSESREIVRNIGA